MQIPASRCLLLSFLLIATCFVVISGRGGRGGGGRGGGSRGGSSYRSSSSSSSSSRYSPSSSSSSSSRYSPSSSSSSRYSPSSSNSNRYHPATSRPATYRPATYRPAPAPTQRPAPRPTQRPQPPSPKPPSVTPKPSAPGEPVVVRQPASNPNFRESNPVQGSSDKQPAYNPNYKPDNNAPGGPPPPYSPGGQPVPNAPLGPPPPYQPNQPSSYGSPGQRPPYPVQPGVQPPPYTGPQGRPPAYPGLPTHSGPAPYPVQPGSPGVYPQQPGVNRPYPVQPSYPAGYQQQPGVNRPYPVQPSYPGGYHQQPGVNRPYPVQPGSYPQHSGYYQPGVNRPYPQQPLGTNVWQPQSGMPAPAYMNYGGLPTGANMYTKPHKKKGFIGSLMSLGGSKPHKIKKNKYYGSYPSSYGVGGAGMGHMGGVGHMGGIGGKHGSSAAMYSILPYMAMKKAPKFKPKFGSMPMFMPMPHYHHHHYYGHYGHYGHGMNPEYAHYYDVYNENYIGRCQRPLKKENYAEMECKSTHEDIQCGAKCEVGYKFPDNSTIQYNKCWHVTGVWRPTKNFPKCIPVCEDGCLNGGSCTRPGYCSCPPEYRGDRCRYHFLNCDARLLTKGEKVGWVCHHSKNETVCKIRCKEPGQFETPPADEYKCTPDGKWTPDSIPHCIVKGILPEKNSKMSTLINRF